MRVRESHAGLRQGPTIASQTDIAASMTTDDLAAIEQPLSAARWDAARRGFSTRRVRMPDDALLLSGELRPRAGDLVLAEVLSIGHHTRLESPHGRRVQLHAGDEIIVAYGNRYAPDQFEAEVPADLDDCHLAAAGGMAARLLSRHARSKKPTCIRPLGLIANADGRPLNLRDWALDSRSIPKPLPPVVVVAGTAMNAGKTTAAAALIRGLTRAGKRVGAAKVTGTGAGGDYWQMWDAGAVEVVDFTDAGYASTYLLGSHEVEKVFLRLLSHLGNQSVDVIVVEVADGILQAETAELLASPGFAYYCDHLVFAAGDAMGAVAGVQWLLAHGLDVCALSGALTAAPLAVREATTALGLPVLSKNQLADANTAATLVGGEAR